MALDNLSAIRITPNGLLANLVGALDVLNNFTAVDVVGIFDGDTLQQVFANARPLKASVRESSMVMNHPVETGVVLSDHHIINQIEISIPLFIDSKFYNSVYEQIKSAFIAASLLSVQTRTGVYNNMIIVDMPHIEDPEYYTAVTMELRLKEVIYIVPTSVSSEPAPANYSPVEPANSNTIPIGQKYPSLTPVSTTNQKKISGYAGSW